MFLSLEGMKKGLFILCIVLFQVSFGQNSYVLAERYFKDGAFEKASVLFEELSKKNPNNTTYLKKLISSYQESGRFTAATTLLKNRLSSHPNQSYLFVEIGYNYDRQYKKEEAIFYYDKAIAAIDENPAMGGFIGRLFKQNALLDYAIAAYEKTIYHNPNANYQFLVAQIYGEKGYFDKMFTSYIELLDQNENYLNNVQRYASRYITDDKFNEKNIAFKKALIKKSVSNPKDVWNTLLSWLFIQQKEYRKAFIQEKALFNRSPNNSNYITELGRTAFENEAYDSAKTCFDFIINNSASEEEVLTAQLYKMNIAIAQNEPNIDGMFNTLYSRYGKKTATLQLQLAQANYLTFIQNKPKQAIAILEHALQIAPSKFQKAAIKIQLGEVFVFTGNYNRALIYFSQVQTGIKNHPLAQKARFKVAQTSFFKNDFKWAFAQLKVLKSSTTQLIANDALDLFLTISDNQVKDSIDTGLKNYATASLLAFQNKNEQALDTLQHIITTYKGQNIEDEALYKQAQLFAKINAFEKAIASYMQLITLNEEGIFVDDAIYDIAEIYFYQLNNTEKASEYYQKIIFDHPSSIYLVDARNKFRKLRGDTIH